MAKNDEPKMLYYAANGKQVPEGDPSAVRQYLSDDEARPASGIKLSAVVGLPPTPADADVPAADDGDASAAKEKAQVKPAAIKARKSSPNKSRKSAAAK